MNRCMLTTADNVFNPFTDFDRWLEYDTEYKYNTCEWLSIFSKTSEHFDDFDYNEDISNAIDMFLMLNPSGIHYKLYENEADEVIKMANKAYNETTYGVSETKDTK